LPDDRDAAALLARAEPYLLRRYGAEPDRQFVHWGLMAAAVRYRTTGDRRFLDFSADLAGAFVAWMRPEVSVTGNGCAGAEGLAAAAGILAPVEAHASPAAELRARVSAELTNAFAMQVAPGETRLALGKGRFIEDPAIAAFAGAFRNGRFAPGTRIDSTQHCLSALIEYLRLPAAAGPAQ
jgi:hypothetical protein